MIFNDVKWKLPNGEKYDAANEKIWSEQIMAFYLFYFENVNVIRVMFSTNLPSWIYGIASTGFSRLLCVLFCLLAAKSDEVIPRDRVGKWKKCVSVCWAALHLRKKNTFGEILQSLKCREIFSHRKRKGEKKTIIAGGKNDLMELTVL